MFDFCINGSGMVGAALAIGLAQQGYNVALIENQLPVEFTPQQPPDLRLSALSHNSVALLKKLGAWEHIVAMRTQPYSALSVWESDSAKTDFDSQMAGLSELGFFVENRLVQLGCLDALKAYSNVTRFTDTEIRTASFANAINEATLVTLSDGQSLTCKWLVGADGATSKVRQMANIGTEGWQYGQQAMGIIIETQKPSPHITWQMFTPSGPRALLPMYGHFSSLIWYDEPERLQQLNKLNDDQLVAQVNQAFPERLHADVGEFRILKRAVFPLTRSHARHYVLPGVMLIGDAAHTINPLAGQGVNLGFKDIECLLNITKTRPDIASQLFVDMLLQEYEKPRRKDNLAMMSAMDAFYVVFSNTLPPLKWLRRGVLKLVQNANWGKQQVLKYALGIK